MSLNHIRQKELVLRVNNIMRRVYTKDKQNITYKDYMIDVDKRMVLLNNQNINLTTLEFVYYICFLRIDKNLSQGMTFKQHMGRKLFWNR